jgi:hypothetical protein
VSDQDDTQTIREANALRQMTQMDGWKVYCRHLDDIRSGCTDDLESQLDKKPEKITLKTVAKYAHRRQVLGELTDWVASRIEAGEAIDE